VRQRSINSERKRLQRLVATGPGLDVSLDFAPALLIGSLRGHLRAGSRTHLRATFRDALAQRPERLVIDTSGLVTYDPAGLVGLVESLDQARLDEVPVAVSSLAPADEQILREVSTHGRSPGVFGGTVIDRRGMGRPAVGKRCSSLNQRYGFG
jgi:anti-anti-sigma regulatory factor